MHIEQWYCHMHESILFWVQIQSRFNFVYDRCYGGGIDLHMSEAELCANVKKYIAAGYCVSLNRANQFGGTLCLKRHCGSFLSYNVPCSIVRHSLM